MNQRVIVPGAHFLVPATVIFFLVVMAVVAIAPPRASAAAVRVGEKAPLFEIQGFNSQKFQGEKNILLVFYRGLF